MIYIDDRAGSRELLKHLPSQTTCVKRLDFGDACFEGNGPSERLHIGYEIKSIPDAIQCMQTGRLAGYQLPGMRKRYSISYLVLHDRARATRDGALEFKRASKSRAWLQPHSPTLWADFISWLLTLELQGGARVIMTSDLAECASVILAHYRWWQKPWDAHASLRVFDDSVQHARFHEPTTLRKMAAQLPQIRWHRSKAIAHAFASPAHMCLADEKQWREIEGIGPKIARAVVRELNPACLQHAHAPAPASAPAPKRARLRSKKK